MATRLRTGSVTALSAKDLILERLALVRDPELEASITELGMVGEVSVHDRVARVEVALTTVNCPLRSDIERDVREAVLEIEGVDEIIVTMGVLNSDAKASLMRTARKLAQARTPPTSVPRSAPIFMIASGKGGVGKSSITANVAIALAQGGLRVCVLDADI